MSRLKLRIRQVAAPLGVMVLGLALAAWFVTSRPQALPQPPEEQIWPVSVVEIAPADIQPDIVLFGEVGAAREAELRAMVAGRLVTLDDAFRNGRLIAAGSELAVIDPVDYENRLAEARAELARSDALLAEQRRELEWEIRLRDNAAQQVELARRALERTEQLAASGRESQKVRDDAATALAVAEQTQLQRAQTVARLRARVLEQQAAYEKAQTALARAERELAHTRVVAPFTGYVTDVRLALGQRVAVGEKLGRLLSADELEVRFEIPEADFARLSNAGIDAIVGRRLQVVWNLGAERRVFGAVLARIGAEIDPTSGGIALYAELDAAATARGLRAGAFVEIRVPDVRYENVYRLPARAVVDGSEVYAVIDDRLRARPIEIVREIGDEVLVRGALEPGLRVVARTFAGIGPGLRARVL